MISFFSLCVGCMSLSFLFFPAALGFIFIFMFMFLLCPRWVWCGQQEACFESFIDTKNDGGRQNRLEQSGAQPLIESQQTFLPHNVLQAHPRVRESACALFAVDLGVGRDEDLRLHPSFEGV
jgi:hypothetical protein